jgi:hypothetical protein
MKPGRVVFQLACVALGLGGAFAALSLHAVPLGQAAQADGDRLSAGLHLLPPLTKLEWGAATPLHMASAAHPMPPVELQAGGRLRLAALAASDAPLKAAVAPFAAADPADPAHLRRQQRRAEKDAGGRVLLLGLHLSKARETERVAAAAAQLGERVATARAALTRAEQATERANVQVEQAAAVKKAEWASRLAEQQARTATEVARLAGAARLDSQAALSHVKAEGERLNAQAELAEARAESKTTQLNAALLATDTGRLHVALEAVRRQPPQSLRGRSLKAWRQYFLPTPEP